MSKPASGLVSKAFASSAAKLGDASAPVQMRAYSCPGGTMTETSPAYLDQAQVALEHLLRDRPIAYHPILARAAGSVTAGVLLSQLLYWTSKSKDGWVYRTREELEEETALSRYEQEGARKKLLEAGLLQEERRGLPYRLYYKVNQPRLTSLLAAPISPTELPTSKGKSPQLASENAPISPTGKTDYLETSKETITTTPISPSGILSPTLIPPDYPAWAEGFALLEPKLSRATLQAILKVTEDFKDRVEPTAGLVARCIDYWRVKAPGKKASWVARWGNWLEHAANPRIVRMADRAGAQQNKQEVAQPWID